ncbi:MAG: tyrosine-type recombinase/integrase [Actinomycetota bacterium]|nr:tyrosine-type recombinase/integrase [Actinomycetota bacterium]
MSVHRTRRGSGTVYVVRWREGESNRQRTFDRHADARSWDTEVRRRRQLGTLHLLDAGTITLDEYVTGTWAQAHAATLAPKTRSTYGWAYDHHVAPRLGALALHELTPDVVARFQSDLLAANAGHEGTRKALMLLSSVLQRAAEAQLIPHNPVRLVRKARAPLREEIRPLAPASVERLRAVLPAREALAVSLLAYAGLRPGELRTMRWAHVADRTLIVGAPKTRQRRTVRLLDPLRRDIAVWRLARGRPGDDEPVIPADAGGEWTAEGFNKWRGRVFVPALARAGLPPARPYDLRHSFASLLLHEGRSVIYVARQLGHGAELTMRTYGHVIDELDDAPRLDAEAAIGAARAAGVRVSFASTG